jgi:hypothetical protein
VVTLPAASTTLTGSGTDGDGTVTGYAWTKVSGSGNIESPASATTNITGLTQGVSVFQLIVTDNLGANSVADQVTVTVNPATGPGVVYRINAGGPQVTNSIGTFAADNFFSPSPGFAYSVTNAIAGTTDDAIYQTERSSTTTNGTFSYAFPVSNGTYTVKLHFAEIYWTAVGNRLFDVSLEGVKVLDNYDIVKKVGAFTATTETFNAIVSDGTLNILFSAALSDGGVDQPKISAIEILTSGTGNQPPVANAGPDKEVTAPATTTTLVGSGTDADGTVVGYAWTKISGSGTIATPSSATTNITGLTQGVSVFQLIVTDNLGAASVGDQVTVNVVASTSPGFVYRINSGGPQVTNAIGTFSADNLYSPVPGFTTTSTNPIGGTSADAMFQDQRSTTAVNSTFSYAFPVSSGSYTVNLYFAEVNFTAVGSRVFDIFIEGVLVKDNFDIVKKVGPNAATAEVFSKTITDGTLNITFSSLLSDGGVNKPTLSAIEVYRNPALTVVPGLSTPGIINTMDSLDNVLNQGFPRAYPNPSVNGMFNITLPSTMSDQVSYDLLSASGVLLKKGVLPAAGRRGRRTLPLDFSREAMKAGMYMLQLTGSEQKAALKLLRE